MRSRRLAVSLICLAAAYSVVGTLVPQPGAGGLDRYSEWAMANPDAARLAESLGLDRAFSSPLFVGMALLLGACTLACAFERTAAARASYARMRTIGSDDAAPARGQRLEVPLPEDRVPADVLERATVALRRLGLRTRSNAGGTTGVSGAWGVWGSPLFHWATGSVIFAIAAGALLGLEGYLRVPVGASVVERHDAYARLDEGPLFAERHSGAVVAVTDLVPDLVEGGVSRGPSPHVAVSVAAEEPSAGRVYPNRPLRSGTWLYHYHSYGLAADVSLVDPAGAEADRQWLYFDLASGVSTHTAVLRYGFDSPSGTLEQGFLAVVPLQTADGRVSWEVPEQPRIEVAVIGATGVEPTVTVSTGEAVQVMPGGLLRLNGISHSVTLGVDHDPMLGVVYLLLMAAVAGLALSLLVEPRMARVELAGAPARLVAYSWAPRRAAAFRIEVERAVVAALESGQQAEGADTR